MKMLFEFFPIIVFFSVYKLKGIFFATAAAIISGLIQLAYTYISKRKIEPMLLISVLVLTLFGSFTLLLHNELFIKWKPTILYWIFASALAVSQGFLGKNLIKEMLSKQINAPEHVWKRLGISWILFFAGAGALNLFIMSRFSTNVWVNFKLFGLLGCMIVFVIAQSLFLMPYIEKDDQENKDKQGGI